MPRNNSEQRQQMQAEAKETTDANGVTIRENVDENRLQIIFPGKPSAEARAILKSHGFRWSPMQTAWQRQLNNSARWSAQAALAEIERLAQ